MAEERPGSKQEIVAGDGSQNFQALRDVNVHNHTPPPTAQSSIQRPTNSQIAAFDHKTAEIIKAASLELRMPTRTATSPLSFLFLLLAFAAAVIALVFLIIH
jgi:hypothetical protein